VHHPLNFNKKKEAHLCQISSIRLEALICGNMIYVFLMIMYETILTIKTKTAHEYLIR